MRLLGPEDGCPEAFVGCLTVEDAHKLEGNLRALRRYTREAATRCYVAPDGGTQ